MSELEAGNGLRTIATWPAPIDGQTPGQTHEELLVSFDRGRNRRVLIVPAMFDEANKLRRFTLQTMRAADTLGIDTFLPDLPGCNESLQPLEDQTLSSWRGVMAAAVSGFGITHVLAIRGGALIAPDAPTIWHYAPLSGAKLLRGMIRARTVGAREAGREETSDQLLEQGRNCGLTLAGWPIGSQMLRELETARPSPSANIISPNDRGAAGLWLRAEPGEDEGASGTLASIIAGDLGEPT